MRTPVVWLWASLLLLATSVPLLVGCQKVPPAPGPQALRWAENARPSDVPLAQKYERSCQNCHSNRSSTAPLTGFAPDWQARLPQGMPTLVNHARDGYKAMPARGFCNDCTDQELQALIAFMSTPSLTPTKE